MEFLLLDTSLPIIPGKQMAGINIGDNINNFDIYLNILDKNKNELFNTSRSLIESNLKNTSIYNLENTLMIYFDIETGKVFKLVAEKLYEGMLFGKVKTGDFLKSIVDAGYCLLLDDFDYVFYIKDVPGICIEVYDSELSYFRDAMSLKIKYFVISEPDPIFDELFFRDLEPI